MHMHAYMHAYIHTLVGSGPLFPQSVLQCLCSCAAFRRILCSIDIYVYVCVECNRDHHSEILRNDVDPLETPYTGSMLGLTQVHPFHCYPK